MTVDVRKEQVTEGEGLSLLSLFPNLCFQDSYSNCKVTESIWSRPSSDLKHIPQTEWEKKPTQGNLKIRPNAAHPLNKVIGTTPVSSTQKGFSPDLLWYLLILVAPSAASLGLRGLGELQKPIPVFSSACPLWQLQ